MTSMVPAGEGGGGGNDSTGGGGNTGTEQAPPNLAASPPQQPDSQQQQQQQQHSQHPPPSPLSGCYLLVVLPEPHSAQHKDLILNRLAKGFLSWDKDSCHVDLEKELQALVVQAPEGEEARNGERLIQYATENLVTEVLIYPQSNTLLQCIRNLLASFTKHRHIIHAGYTFGGNGSWILQDGTFSLADFLDAFSEHEVQRVLRAYENSVTVDIHCASVGDWTTTRFSKEACTRACRVRVNPDDVLTAGVPAITNFTNYIGQYLIAQTLDQLMEPSDVVGNIRFSHPTLYVFPGGQGDAALFGINGFNMLVDGGFARKACFWDFARHLDRLDAVLVTRINNSNIGGMSSVLRKKKEMYVYPQIGHFFCNLVERRHSNSPDGDKDIDPLILDLIDIGQEMIVNLRHINLRPHPCYRDPEPINLYHKVGHGTLDMYVLSPSKDSREVREFLAKWNASDSKLFAGSHKKDSSSVIFPIQNLLSICAMLVWQPANPEDTITRILFPGSTPQHKIFEGFERLKHLEFLKHPVCTAKSLSPSTSLATLKDKSSILKPKLSSVERENKRLVEGRKEKRDSAEVKAVKKDPVIEESAAKISTGKPVAVSAPKSETKAKKVVENKKIESEVKESKKIEKELKETKVEVKKVERSEGSDVETKKTDVVKAETEKTVLAKDPKLHKAEIKKRDIKDTSKLSTKVSKVDSGIKPSAKPADKKSKVGGEKKDAVKSSPTTPKKSISSTTIKSEIPKTTTKSAVRITSKMTSSAPAKSTKDANNRKVVEQKNNELSSMATSSGSAAGAKAPAKAKAIERKPIPIGRRPKPVSPSKARLPISPVKSIRSTPKSEKDAVIRKVKGGTTDSSAVSTPTGIESETAIKLIDKNLTEKSEDMSLDSIESKVLADLKEEREVVEEIEAVLQKAERIEEARKEERFEGDDEITAEATDKKEEDVTEEDVTAEMDEIPKKISRKESQEFTEEDEYLIVEKEEIYTEDSMQSGEAEQKHHLDEAESEKIKEDRKHEGYSQAEEKEDADEKKDEVPEKKVADSFLEPKKSTDLSPEHKELLKEEMKQIIASAKEVVKKTEEKDDSGKRDSEDITKDPSSLSPDKLDSVKPEVEMKEVAIEKLEESQERISTLESGATTTAPTLPEDERIPLDEIKEDVDEKHAIEEVKEKDVIAKQKEDIPDTLPVVSKAEIKVLDVRPVTQQGIIRDVVKTPDEVADLPVHEEVDPKLYRLDDLDKEKELKTTMLFQEQKEPAIVSTAANAAPIVTAAPIASAAPAATVKETKDKGVFSFFGKVADKFEKGIDKLTKKARRDSSDKDAEDKSSKSSSPKEPKPQEKVSIGEITFEKVSPKLEKSVSVPLDSSAFLESEKKDSESHLVEHITSAESKIILPEKDAVEDMEDIEEVEAFVEEASKKFRNVKDSLQDSLESLDEKVDELSKLPTDSKDTVRDTLSGAAEKLIDIKPDSDSVLEMKEPEKVTFVIPSSEELEEEDGDSDGIVRDFKEAVRDVAEVLVGTAGIEIEKEEKPKDVVEIVKKVAKVLKTDDFLTDQSLDANNVVKTSNEDLMMPKKVGVTEELSVQEVIEEFIEKESIKSSAKSYDKAEVFEITEETYSKIDKSIIGKTSTEKEEAMRLCDDIMKSDIVEYIVDTEPDMKQDVMALGLEEVCVKTIAKREVHDEKVEETIVQPEIGFEQNLSPGKAEYVTVTPGSTPTSPKIPTEGQLADLPTEYTNIFNKNESLESLIEEFIVSKNHKITMQILEYIATIKRVPKDKIINIIHEIIIKCNISRENVADNIEVLRLSDNVSLEKRLEIENYIYNQYLNKNNKIILSTIEEISTKQMIPKQLVIEIIEEIIVKKHIKRESAYDIDKDKYLKLFEEDLQTPFEAGEEKALSLSTDEIIDEKIVDGFVSIPSTETVKALQSHDESKIVDDFEAVEQEYKVSGVSSISPSEKLISEKDKQEMTEDVSDVVEADEKFVKETFEKDLKEDRIADKEQAGKDLKDDEHKSIQNLEILETDTKEKYLDEDKEKTLGVAKTAAQETEVEEKDSGKLFDADATGHADITDLHKSQIKETEYDMTQSLLKLSTAETTKEYDLSDISPVESVISKSPIEKDVTIKKSEDLKTEEQQSNKLVKEELEELASVEKHVVQSERAKYEIKSKSPSEEKEMTPEKIIDTGKLISVTDKPKDETKSVSVEKEVHKIETLPDIKEISEDLKSEIDKTERKSKSPSVEKEVREVDTSFDAKEIPKDLTLETDKFEHKSKSPSAEKEIDHIDISSDTVEISKDLKVTVEDEAKDISRSPSAEKDVPKSETSIATELSKDLKSATDKLEDKSKSSSIKEEIHVTDISSEVVADSKDLQSMEDKTKDSSKSPSVEREDEKPEIISAKPASHMTEEKPDIKEISTLSEKVMTKEAHLEFDKLEDKLITKRDSISSSLETKVDKADTFSEKVKPDEATVVAIDAREDLSKSKSPSVEKEKSQVEERKIAADEIGVRSKSPSLEKELDNTELSVAKTTVTKADDVLKSPDAVITEDSKEADTKLQDKSKSPSPEKQVETTDISLVTTIKDSKLVTDKSEDKSRSPSAEKEEKVKDSNLKADKSEDKSRSPSTEKDEEKAKDLEAKADKPDDKSRSPSVEKDEEKGKDSEAKADKPEDKSRSPSAEKDEKKVEDSEAKADKLDDKSRSPSAEKDEEKVKDTEAKVVKPEDKSRSPSAEKDQEKAKDSEAKADKPEDKWRSPSAEKDEEKAKDSEAKTDKPEDKSRSPSAEKDEEKVKDSEAKAVKPEDKSRSPSAEKDEEKAKDSEAKADKPEDKSRSPSAEKDEDKAKDSEAKADKPEDKSRSPSAEKVEKKVEDSEAKADKPGDKSRSPSAEKDEGKTKDSELKTDKPDDKSRSPSAEKDEEKVKDSEAKADKPDDKSRSPSAEKDEDKAKDSEAKADKPEDKSRSPSAEKDEKKVEDSEAKADKPGDKSRSPSAEKDEGKTKDSELKTDKPDDKSRSPSAEKDEEKVKDSEAKADKPDDKSRSPSAEKDEEEAKDLEVKADKPDDKSRSPSAEKDEEKAKDSEAKADKPEDKSRSPSAEKDEKAKDSEAKADKPEDKSRSPSAEKDEDKAKDSELKADKSDDKSRSPSAEKDEEKVKESEAKADKPDNKSRSPSAEKDEEMAKDSEAKADKPEDKSRSPSAEKDEEKAKDSEAKVDQLDNKSRSPSAEKAEKTTEDITDKLMLLETTKTADEKIDAESKSSSVEREISITIPISSVDMKAVTNKSDDKSRSPSAEKDDKKTEDTSKSKILLEDSKEENVKSTDVLTDKTEAVIEKSDDKSKSPSIEKEPVLTMSDSKIVSDKLDPEKEEKKGDVEEISHKSEDRSKSPSVEKTLAASEDVADKSLLSDTKKVEDQKPDVQSKSMSLERELTHTEILITKAVSLEESEEIFDKLKDSSTSSTAGKDEEKAKDSEVVIEKTADRSKSPSEEKYLGMSEDVADQKIQLHSSKEVDQKTDDTSKSPSVEKEAQKEIIAISSDDTKLVSDKSEDKLRSPSAEKDEGKLKYTEVVFAKAEDRSKSPSVEKELGTSQDATVKSESSETSKTVDQKIDDRSKSPSVEKEEAQRETSDAKSISLEARRSVTDKLEDKSRSPSAEKDEGKLKDSGVAFEKSEDKSKSPSVEKQLASSDVSTVASVTFETSKAVDQKPDDRSKSPSTEKEEAQMEISVTKSISSEDTKTVSNKSVDKSRSPSAEKDEVKAIDSEVVVEKAEVRSKSPSVENELRTSQDPTATSMPLETSKSVHQKTDDKSKSPSIEKEEAQKETLLAKPESLEDTKSVSDKSGDKSRSPSVETDKDKSKETEVTGEKSKDRSKSPSVEKQLTTSEDSAVKLVSLETSKADDHKTEDRSKSPSVEKEEAQKQISLTKPIPFDESITASDKPVDKSRSPSAEKDEGKRKGSQVTVEKSEDRSKSPSVEKEEAHKEISDRKSLSEKSEDKTRSPSIEKDEGKSKDTEAAGEKSKDRSKSPSVEKQLGTSEDSAVKLVSLETWKALDQKTEDRSKSPSIEKEEAQKEVSLAKPISSEDMKSVSDKSEDKSRSPSAEKDEGKAKDSEVKADKPEDKSRSPSAEKDGGKAKESEVAVEKLEDILKSSSVEKQLGKLEDSSDKSLLLEKTDDGSKSPSIEKEVAKTEVLLTKAMSSADAKAMSDKSDDKSRSPSAEKDEKRKDSIVIEKNVGISEVSTEKSISAEQEKPEIVKPKDKIDSFSAHENLLEIRAVESSKESIDFDEKIKSPSLSQVELLEKGDTFGSKSINLVGEKSLQDEFMERKSSVTSVDSHAEDKGKDRSRSHSVFETGDRTPSVRSRAASLYDDKLTEKLALLDLTKDSSSYADHSFEEKDELRMSQEALNLQQEILKTHLDNESYTNSEIKKLITDYILNEFISKNKVISNQIIDELANNYNIDRNVVIEIINEIISRLKLERKMVFELEDNIFDESAQKIFEDEEKLRILINDQYIAKKKLINSNIIDDIARNNSVSRHLVILVIENIITARGLRRDSIVAADVFDVEVLVEKDKKGTVTEAKQGQAEETTQSRQPVSTDDQSNVIFDTAKSFSPSPELKSSSLYKPERPEPHIDEEINISESKRTEIEALMLDDYINRGIKITESVLEQIVIRTALPKYIIIEIVEEIIIKKGLSREMIANLSIFHDEDYSDSQQNLEFKDKAVLETTERKSSGYSTPEARHYDDGLEKSISYSDYESPFHKAFIGGMTEIRTTHITTLSGKSTPEFGPRDGTPDSSSEIISRVTSTITNVTDKAEKADDQDRFGDFGQSKINEEKDQLKKNLDEIHDDLQKKEKEAFESGTISSLVSDSIETTKQFINQESLSSKISSDKVHHKVTDVSVDTLINLGKASNEEEKLISLESQSLVDLDDTIGKGGEQSKQQEGGEKTSIDSDFIKQMEESSQHFTSFQSSSSLLKDLVTDEKIISKKSTSEVSSLPKDVTHGDSTGKSTPEVSMSPLIRDGSMIQSHLSGRSTPDKRSDNRSRTATPEGFRSGDVIRTIITTTRTMSDDGEIITTTREVTEATNEKGETVVLTEKTDVQVDDKLPENLIGEVKPFDVPSSEITDKDADLTSPRSDLSSGHSRAATHIWGSSEERHTYSDEEQSSPPLFSSPYPSEHAEDESSAKVKDQRKSETMSSTAMSSSFYGELPSETAHFSSSLTGVSDTASFPEQDEFSFKKFTVEKEYAGGYEDKGSKKLVDEADLDFEKALTGLKREKADVKGGLALGESSFSQELEKSSSSHPDDRKKDPLAGWGSPLGLPSPKAPRKFNLRSPIQACSSADLSPDSLNFDVINDWGEPMRLPSPAPATNEVSNKGSPGTPKKEKKQAKKVISENLKNKKRSESPNKNEKKLKDSKNKVQPVYLDLAYVAHHGNSFYTALEFFKKIRARYYVFSGTEPSREVYDALLEAKKTWEDKELEVTMIPTYDTDTLGYWVADNEEALAAHHIDLSPSASRCTINLQDHETSCSAYRLEF